MAPLSVCIICGIRASQQEWGFPGMMNTITLRLLERYLPRGFRYRDENAFMPEGMLLIFACNVCLVTPKDGNHYLAL